MRCVGFESALRSLRAVLADVLRSRRLDRCLPALRLHRLRRADPRAGGRRWPPPRLPSDRARVGVKAGAAMFLLILLLVASDQSYSSADHVLTGVEPMALRSVFVSTQSRSV